MHTIQWLVSIFFHCRTSTISLPFPPLLYLCRIILPLQKMLWYFIIQNVMNRSIFHMFLEEQKIPALGMRSFLHNTHFAISYKISHDISFILHNLGTIFFFLNSVYAMNVCVWNQRQCFQIVEKLLNWQNPVCNIWWRKVWHFINKMWSTSRVYSWAITLYLLNE